MVLEWMSPRSGSSPKGTRVIFALDCHVRQKEQKRMVWTRMFGCCEKGFKPRKKEPGQWLGYLARRYDLEVLRAARSVVT